MTSRPPTPKEYVLNRFPEAKVATVSMWPDGTPRHRTIIAGNQRLELPRQGNSAWVDDNLPQTATVAWREAYYWCLKYPEERSQPDLLDRPVPVRGRRTEQ